MKWTNKNVALVVFYVILLVGTIPLSLWAFARLGETLMFKQKFENLEQKQIATEKQIDLLKGEVHLLQTTNQQAFDNIEFVANDLTELQLRIREGENSCDCQEIHVPNPAEDIPYPEGN